MKHQTLLWYLQNGLCMSLQKIQKDRLSVCPHLQEFLPLACDNLSFISSLFQLMAQERLYREIVEVCGTNKVTEENLCQLPYLSAIFHETLRRHSPVPVVPLRYVDEDTELGGYHVPAGTEVITAKLFHMTSSYTFTVFS